MMKAIQHVYTKDTQIWTDLNCYDILPNKYEISNCGNVRIKEDQYPLKKNLLLNEYGAYYTVRVQTITSGRCVKHFLIHRLVATQFNLQRRPDQIQVNHINNNGLDNEISNLEWCTPEENSSYAYKFMNDIYSLKSLSNLQIYSIYQMIESQWDDISILNNFNMPYSYENYMIIFRIRLSVYNNTPPIFDNIRYNKSLYPISYIITICEMLQEGKNYKEIGEVLNIDLSTSQKRRHFSEYVRQIRGRITFNEISKNYIW